MSRKLSHDFKLAARTAPELHEAISLFVLRAAASGLKFQGRRVGVEALINALLIDFLDRPDPERFELLRSNVGRFEQVMQSDEPVRPESIPGRPARRARPVAAQDLPLPGDADADPQRPGPKRGPGRARRQG